MLPPLSSGGKGHGSLVTGPALNTNAKMAKLRIATHAKNFLFLIISTTLLCAISPIHTSHVVRMC